MIKHRKKLHKLLNRKDKHCPDCDKIIPIKEFYRNKHSYDGYAGICKECSYIRTKKETYRANRTRWNREHKEKIQEAVNAYKLRNPKKAEARYLFNKVKNLGKIKKQSCEICGNEKAQGHHFDYSKQYDVRWFCIEHHKAIHSGRLIL